MGDTEGEKVLKGDERRRERNQQRNGEFIGRGKNRKKRMTGREEEKLRSI